MADGPIDDAQQELQRARDALTDARVLLEGEGTDAGTLYRLYYAAFHGAQAALYARGRNPSSHGHVRQQFGQHLVLTDEVSRDMGRLLGTLYDYRQTADYGDEPPSVDLEALSEEVDEFVQHMGELVTGPGK